MPQWVQDIAKALMGAAMAGLSAAGTALVGDQRVDVTEWVAIAFAVVASLYAIYWTPDSMSPIRKALAKSNDT